jgi:hypothetical protein
MRLKLVLPAHRLWRWHRNLIKLLAQSHELNVAFEGSAPPYPASLRWRLRIEHALLCDECLLGSNSHAPMLRPQQAGEEDIVIDLSERPTKSEHCLEVRYDGSPDTMALIDTLLARGNPLLSIHRSASAKPLASSRPGILDKASLLRGLEDTFARCTMLVERALKPEPNAQAAISLAESSIGPRLQSPLAAGMFRMLEEKAWGWASKHVSHREPWIVALRDDKDADFTPLPDDGKRFYADPFLQQWRGRNFLFVEEFQYQTRKAVISVSELAGARVLAPPVRVLERPYHLSYPLVLEDNGVFYMVPETGAHRTVELYRAVNFPWRWELERVLLEGAPFADPTPVLHDGVWWLFVAVSRCETAVHDELLIFHSDCLAGPWHPHAANPVKSDCRSSRPAGRIVERGGRLFRPAQDCEQSYGAGLVWLEITELTPTCFKEREVARWDGRTEIGAGGLHSFDHVPGVQVLDFKWPVGRGPFRRAAPTRRPQAGGTLERMLAGSQLRFELR